MTPAPELLDLAARVEAATASDNALDVEVEIALFEPEHDLISARANAAGSKLIYTRSDHSEVTHRAGDWTQGASGRRMTVDRLRARATQEQSA